MEDNELLKVSDLSVVYQTSEETVYAVNHVDLELKRGQTVGIVGETGANINIYAIQWR